jgi:hypothetical protein
MSSTLRTIGAARPSEPHAKSDARPPDVLRGGTNFPDRLDDAVDAAPPIEASDIPHRDFGRWLGTATLEAGCNHAIVKPVPNRNRIGFEADAEPADNTKLADAQQLRVAPGEQRMLSRELSGSPAATGTQNAAIPRGVSEPVKVRDQAKLKLSKGSPRDIAERTSQSDQPLAASFLVVVPINDPTIFPPAPDLTRMSEPDAEHRAVVNPDGLQPGLISLKIHAPEPGVARVADLSEVAAEGVVRTPPTPSRGIAPNGTAASESDDLATGSPETDAKASSILTGLAIGTPSSISSVIQDDRDILNITPAIGVPPVPEHQTNMGSPSVEDESRHHSIPSRGAPVGLPYSGASSSVQTEPPAGPAAVWPAVEASPVRLIDQLLQHVITSADTGGREVVLKLNPPELGDLTVRVLVNGREVSAWFASPQVEVQQAITQALGQLHTGLGNALSSEQHLGRRR